MIMPPKKSDTKINPKRIKQLEDHGFKLMGDLPHGPIPNALRQECGRLLFTKDSRSFYECHLSFLTGKSDIEFDSTGIPVDTANFSKINQKKKMLYSNIHMKSSVEKDGPTEEDSSVNAGKHIMAFMEAGPNSGHPPLIEPLHKHSDTKVYHCGEIDFDYIPGTREVGIYYANGKTGHFPKDPGYALDALCEFFDKRIEAVFRFDINDKEVEKSDSELSPNVSPAQSPMASPLPPKRNLLTVGLRTPTSKLVTSSAARTLSSLTPRTLNDKLGFGSRSRSLPEPAPFLPELLVESSRSLPENPMTLRECSTQFLPEVLVDTTDKDQPVNLWLPFNESLPLPQVSVRSDSRSPETKSTTPPRSPELSPAGHSFSFFHRDENQSLIDFLEKRNRKCSLSELSEGLLLLCGADPIKVFNLITHKDRSFSPTFSLLDLSKKIDRYNTSVLGMEIGLDNFYEAYWEQIVNQCIHNILDLRRCVEAMPSYKTKIMHAILSNEEHTKAILNAPMTSNPYKALDLWLDLLVDPRDLKLVRQLLDVYAKLPPKEEAVNLVC